MRAIRWRTDHSDSAARTETGSHSAPSRFATKVAAAATPPSPIASRSSLIDRADLLGREDARARHSHVGCLGPRNRNRGARLCTVAEEWDHLLAEEADRLQGEFWIHAGVVEAKP